MELIRWLQKKFQARKFKQWFELEENRLSILERETLLKAAKLEVQRQKIELRWLKSEEQRSKKKPRYIS